MTNGTTKTIEVKTSPVAPVVETKESTPSVAPVASGDPVLTREFFALLGQTVKNAENKVKTVKIAGINGYGSVNQSDATAIVRGDNSIVVRKFTPRTEVKNSDGSIKVESETTSTGELTEAGMDRKETIRQYMEWYYNPPIAPIGDPNGFEDSEEQTLVENGAILNAVNLVYKATLTGGTADSLAGVFILQSIESWEESYWLMFDYALRSVVIDGVSLAGSNLIDLINYAHCRYDIIDSTYGFSVDTEISAKADGTPRKRNRASVAGMINTEAKASQSQGKDKGLGSNAPTHQEYNPASLLSQAKAVAESVNKATPPVVSSTAEKIDDPAQLAAIEAAKIEADKKSADDKKIDPVVVPVEDKKSEPTKTEESKESTLAK